MLDFDMTYKDGKVYMEFKETNCIFKEDTHQYFLVDSKTGEVVKELISVTTLLRKHGLAPDYSGVPSETLKAKAEYGNLVHSEIEKYDGVCNVVADFKTTATLHKEAVRWQLSLYNYLICNVADKLQAFHFASPLKVVDIEPIPLEEIERLLECERSGEIYKPKQLVVEAELLARLADLQVQKKAIENEEAELKAQLLEAMRAQDIKNHETETLTILYVAPSTQERVDSKKLKAEMPEIAAKYTKTSKVKDSVRITLKEVQANE